MIDFPTLRHKFSFFLDRKQTRVTLDLTVNAHTHSKQLAIAGMNETSTLRSLALRFAGNRITLYVDCTESAHVDVDVAPQSLYQLMDGEPVVKLFRERKYPLHFDATIERAFERANCQRNGAGSASAGGMSSASRQQQRTSRKLLRNRQSEKGMLGWMTWCQLNDQTII